MAEASLLVRLARELRNGRRSLPQLLEGIEKRFAEVEPKIHAFVSEPERFDRLRADARKLQESHPEGATRPPLYGVPVGVKDVFHVEGLPTGGGSRLPAKELAGEEGSAVGSLRDAGALVLGKTRNTEFAYFAPAATRNPWNPAHTPGGSSSGSAAAVAAGLCPLALGTQTIGSVSRPAAFCGVAGFKPSYGRIPRDGMLELARSFDHVGLFSRDLGGIELAARIVCPHWRAAEVPSLPILGIPGGPYLERASEEAQAHLQAVRRRLRSAGFHVLQVEALADVDEIEARHGLILAAEAARYHHRWYPRFKELYHQKTRELVERGLAIGDGELAAALEERDRFREALAAEFDRWGIDLWLTPAAPGPAPKGLASTGDPIMSLPWTQAGFPTLALPAGRAANGLPLGIQLVAPAGDDERLLAWAAPVEAALS